MRPPLRPCYLRAPSYRPAARPGDGPWCAGAPRRRPGYRSDHGGTGWAELPASRNSFTSAIAPPSAAAILRSSMTGEVAGAVLEVQHGVDGDPALLARPRRLPALQAAQAPKEAASSPGPARGVGNSGAAGGQARSPAIVVRRRAGAPRAPGGRGGPGRRPDHLGGARHRRPRLPRARGPPAGRRPARSRAPVAVPASDVSDVSDDADVSSAGAQSAVRFTPQHLVEALTALFAGEEGGAPEWANPRSVGWALSRLRIEPRRDPHSRRRERYRELTLRAVADLAPRPRPGRPPRAGAGARRQHRRAAGIGKHATYPRRRKRPSRPKRPERPNPAAPDPDVLAAPAPRAPWSGGRGGPCEEPDCPHPGIPAGDLGDGRLRCAEHHLAWRRGGPRGRRATATAAGREQGEV